MLQELLPYVAGALQWARARKKFADLWFLLIVAGASFGFFFVAAYPNALSLPLPDLLAAWWEQAKTILATVQVISSGSNVVADIHGGVPKGVPVTDSK